MKLEEEWRYSVSCTFVDSKHWSEATPLGVATPPIKWIAYHHRDHLRPFCPLPRPPPIKFEQKYTATEHKRYLVLLSAVHSQQSLNCVFLSILILLDYHVCCFSICFAHHGGSFVGVAYGSLFAPNRRQAHAHLGPSWRIDMEFGKQGRFQIRVRYWENYTSSKLICTSRETPRPCARRDVVNGQSIVSTAILQTRSLVTPITQTCTDYV